MLVLSYIFNLKTVHFPLSETHGQGNCILHVKIAKKYNTILASLSELIPSSTNTTPRYFRSSSRTFTLKLIALKLITSRSTLCYVPRIIKHINSIIKNCHSKLL